MRHTIDFCVQRGVLFGGVEHGANEQVGFELGDVHRFVNAEFLLRSGDAVLRGLSQVKASAAGGAQLGDHLFVVGQSHFNFVARLFFELGHDVGGGVVSPGQQTQGFFLRHGQTSQAQRQCGGDKGAMQFHKDS